VIIIPLPAAIEKT
jgi:hypothetical protein